MKFYRYWAPNEATVREGRKSHKVKVYGGSNVSLDDAKRRAQEIAERVAVAIARDGPPEKYAYSDRPLREEIIEEIKLGNEPAAVITRNAYGSLVLNTSRVVFIDVDYPVPKSQFANLGGVVKRLFGRLLGQPPEPAAAAPSRDDLLLERFEQVTRSQSGLGIRVYRTAAGFRLLVTSQPYDPESEEVRRLLDAYKSDALYVRLCKAQQCFRARLTAKYWRCGAAKPPSRYPWADGAQEAGYREWEQAYHQLANQRATCALVGSFGEENVHADVAPILEIHDRLTINDGAPLA